MKRVKNKNNIRVKLCLTQQQLADYLGVSRGLLSMFENDLRFLPSEAMLKLANLEVLQHKLQQSNKKTGKKAPVHPTLQKHHDEIKADLKYRAEFCKSKKRLLENKLNGIMEAHSGVESWRQLLNVLRPADNTLQHSKTDKLWLQVQEKENLQKEMKYGVAIQSKLRVQILTLDGEINACQKMYQKMM